MTSTGIARVGELRRGWPVLAACLVGQMFGVHTIPVYTAGLFVVPLHDDLGWSRTSVSAGIMIMTFATAAMAPVVGRLTMRFDSRRIVLAGLVALAVCYAAMARIGGSVWIYWLMLALMAVVAAGSSSVALSRILVGSFERRRGAALGLALLGTGVTSIFAPLLIGSVVSSEGWRAGYAAIAAAIAVGALVVGLLFAVSRRPGIVPGGHRHVSRSDGRPLRMLFAFFLVSLASGGVVIHFVPLLRDAGWSAAEASRSAALLGASLVVGRLLTGVLLDRVEAGRLAMVLMATSALGFALMGFAHGSSLLLLAPLVGMSLGAELDLMPFLAAREAGLGRFGRAYGLFYAAFLVGAGTSTMIYALLYKLGGDYRLAFAWGATLLGCSALLFAPRARRAAHDQFAGFEQAAALVGKTV